MKFLKQIPMLTIWTTIWEKRWYVISGLVVVTVVVLSSGLFVLYSRNKQLVKEIKTAPQMSTSTVQQLITEVGKLITLPDNEQPTIATVTDVSKLSDQPFFAQAELGDKVLVYSGAKRVVLYRPTTQKIINVASTSGGDEQVAGAATENVQVSPTPTQALSPVKVAVYNGTSTPKLAAKASTRLEDEISSVEVVVQENAAAQDYEKTKIIPLGTVSKEVVADIAAVFTAEETKLPEGETAPEGAEILIIVGADALDE